MEIYDKKGRLIEDEHDALALFGDDQYRRVAFTTVGDADVSTVWLGIDHSFGDSKPILFETLIFGGDRDGQMWRYETEQEALDGHEAIVEALKGSKSAIAALAWIGSKVLRK